MTSGKAPKPESLEAKFKLMTILPYDKRAKRKHILVYGFILDWYHDEYGDALASARHVLAELKQRDPFGQGLYMGDVHSALTELVSWGYLTQEKGAGRRASRYVPVWEKARSVHKSPNATEDGISVLDPPNASVRDSPNATSDSVHKSPNEDPLTGPVHKTGPQVMGSMFDAAPVAPPAVGLEATAAGPASGDGFAEFWKRWPRKHGKKKAEAAWKKIDAELRQAIIEAADAWAAHYKHHGVDMKWIPEPANWLAGERWDEDLPIVHIDAKGAAITKAKANAPAEKATKPSGPRVVDIVGSDIDHSGGQTRVKLVFSERDLPKAWAHYIVLEHPNIDVQCEGQKEFAALCLALGLQSVSDSSELENSAVLVQPAGDGRFEYLPAPAIDLREAA
ncbi:hypothetical protein B5K11_10190 [Rhizobium leguminosarum bv. trifolii]|uniref:hypothetical protein n=1 Tax=Rhizobium leguminosarum TaxID=384 RepID=UPI000E2EB9CE|nr:hypothetical protein [Rhizobium leguminosarum]RFB95303.1 hypothetical protein B5K11_10190 [Rhizobium leguminosarum bv. trifolii]